MEIAQGVAERITIRDVNTKFGTKQSYSALVDGNWYSAGFKAPKFSEGDSIKFIWTANGNYKNMEPDSVELLSKGESPSPRQEATTVRPGPAATDWNAKDRRIGYFSCRNSAIDAVRLAIDIGALKLPAKGDKYEVLLGYINTTADQFFLDTMVNETFNNITEAPEAHVSEGDEE